MKTTNMKKKCQHWGLTLLLLCTTIIHGWAADPVEEAKGKLIVAGTNMGLAATARGHCYTDFSIKKSEFGANLEELQRDNLIDFVDIDPFGLFAVRGTVKSALDFQDHLTLTIELHVEWSAANDANNTLESKVAARDTKYRELLEVAAENFHSLTNEDLEELKGDDPKPSVSKFTEIIGTVAAGGPCPNCNVQVTDVQEISSHIAPCSVAPHEGKGISYFVCNGGTCPLSSKHYVPCGGGCGDLFRPPTYLSSPPSSQGGEGFIVEIYYDDFVKCKEDVAGPVPCNKTYYSCQTEGGLCPRDAKHLKFGACGKHKVEKGDDAATAAHARLEGAPVACTVTLPNSDDGYGNPIRCIIRDTYVCSQHTKGIGCDFYDGVGTYPPGYIVSPTPTPTPTDNTPNCPDCTSDCSSPCSCTNSGTCGGTVVDNTPDCSHCTDGCSACPPQMVACGGASYTGCSGASSRTEHRVESCSNCNNSYWTCSQYAYRHTDEATCRRPGCGVTFYRCNNGTCTSNWGTRSSHWAQ